MSRHYIVIGVSDNQTPHLPPEVKELISGHTVFSGGHRHYSIVKSLLPTPHQWIPITVPIDEVFDMYQEFENIVVFASGDPLFYGFANTIKRKDPDARLTVYPHFNSIQLLAHRLVLPYQDMVFTSLTGRPWENLDRMLIKGESLIGVLTDRRKTPTVIAQRLLEYGYSDFDMMVGEALGGQDERIWQGSLEEAAKMEFHTLNCIILKRKEGYTPAPLGIPESEFEHLSGRPKMITKMPIRLVTLNQMELEKRQVFWDIGFCTGSVSIEARLQFPHLKIWACEKRDASRTLMEKNMRKFRAPGISYEIGDFLDLDLNTVPAPDAVFIGGHGGNLESVLKKIDQYLKPGGVVAMNTVSSDSYNMFRKGIADLNYSSYKEVRLTVDDHNPIQVLSAVKS